MCVLPPVLEKGGAGTAIRDAGGLKLSDGPSSSQSGIRGRTGIGGGHRYSAVLAVARLVHHHRDPSDRASATLVGRRPGRPPVDLSPEHGSAETAQARFVRAIREGEPPATSFADGLAVVRVSDALRASGDGGRWVALDPT